MCASIRHDAYGNGPKRVDRESRLVLSRGAEPFGGKRFDIPNIGKRQSDLHHNETGLFFRRQLLVQVLAKQILERYEHRLPHQLRNGSDNPRTSPERILQ